MASSPAPFAHVGGQPIEGLPEREQANLITITFPADRDKLDLNLLDTSDYALAGGQRVKLLVADTLKPGADGGPGLAESCGVQLGDALVAVVSPLLGLAIGPGPGAFAMSEAFLEVALPLIAIVGWIIYANLQFINSLVMLGVVRPILSVIGTFGGIFLYN